MPPLLGQAQPLPHGFFASLVLALVMVDALLGYLAWEAAERFFDR
jgi:hypothetical protein